MEADLGRPMLDPETRSTDPGVCPFLRAIGGDEFIEPISRPDAANRCLAAGPAIAQGLEWQASVCLARAHVTCPRYLTGETAVRSAPAPATAPGTTNLPALDEPARPRVRPSRTMTPAILVSVLVLVASAAGAVTFVAATGGLQLPAVAPSTVAPASASPRVSAAPTSGQTTASSAAPATAATPSPTAISGPTPVPTVVATSGPTPGATSNRYALLTPCPSKPNCYLYTVKVGDNLRSIANYFGVSYETVLQLNPAITDPSTIQPGDVLTLPPPTR